MNWFIKADDIVLKSKGDQPAENPQNNNQQGQPKKIGGSVLTLISYLLYYLLTSLGKSNTIEMLLIVI